MKFKGKVSISRIYDGEEGYIEIKIQDKNYLEFVTVNVDFTNFAKLLTGQGLIEALVETNNLEIVNKKKETKPLVFEIPKDYKYSSNQYAIDNCHKFVDEGFTASTYFGSQSSFKYENDKQYAVGTQYRYLDEEI